MRLALLAALALSGCKNIGAVCEVTGAGFTRTDHCRHVCVDWEVMCPDGEVVRPRECAGGLCSSDNDCGANQICLQIDSFESNNRCMMARVCE